MPFPILLQDSLGISLSFSHPVILGCQQPQGVALTLQGQEPEVGLGVPLFFDPEQDGVNWESSAGSAVSRLDVRSIS